MAPTAPIFKSLLTEVQLKIDAYAFPQPVVSLREVAISKDAVMTILGDRGPQARAALIRTSLHQAVPILKSTDNLMWLPARVMQVQPHRRPATLHHICRDGHCCGSLTAAFSERYKCT